MIKFPTVSGNNTSHVPVTTNQSFIWIVDCIVELSMMIFQVETCWEDHGHMEEVLVRVFFRMVYKANELQLKVPCRYHNHSEIWVVCSHIRCYKHHPTWRRSSWVPCLNFGKWGTVGIWSWNLATSKVWLRKVCGTWLQCGTPKLCVLVYITPSNYGYNYHKR